MDEFCDDSDDSSTDEEMKRLWDKLERMQTAAKEELLDNEPKQEFQCPSSMSSSSSCSEEGESLPTPAPPAIDSTHYEVDSTPILQRDMGNATNTTPPSTHITKLYKPLMKVKENPQIFSENSNDEEGIDEPVAGLVVLPEKQTANVENTDWDSSSSDDSSDDSSTSSSSSDDSSTSSCSSESSSTDASSAKAKALAPDQESQDKIGEGFVPKMSNEPDTKNLIGSTPQIPFQRLKNPYLNRTTTSSINCPESTNREANVTESQTKMNPSVVRSEVPPSRTLDQQDDTGDLSLIDEYLENPSADEESTVGKSACSPFFQSTAKRPKPEDDSGPALESLDCSSSKSKHPNFPSRRVTHDPPPRGEKPVILPRERATGKELSSELRAGPGSSAIGTTGDIAVHDGSDHNGEGKQMAAPPIQEQGSQAEQESEIDCSLCAPLPYRERQPPVLHMFGLQNRPLGSRRQLPVDSIFGPPLNLLWKSNFDSFNHLQSEVSNALCHSDDNVVVSAPTGAGKTVLFEMAIARFIAADLQTQRSPQSAPLRLSKNRKMVYIAPSKALCEERHEDWSKRLSNLYAGIEVAMITGDVDPSHCYHDLTDSHLILTTPEKWDSLTRRWSENFFLMATVKLLMIDEVHLLGDDSRGCCLESVVSRMKTIQRAARAVDVSPDDLHCSSYPSTTPEAISSCLRTVAVSATLPNMLDVAEFLGANEAYAFDESYRPVPLTKHVTALGNVGKNEYKFWSSLDRHVPELIHRFSNGKQTLIFCHTKKETERVAQLLIVHNFGLRGATSSAPAGTIQHCLDKGIAYHHAGIEITGRRQVEQAFANGKVRCLCATSTLAVGVNLPAHLVIIKGTKTWRGGGQGYQEIDKGSLLQMMGRAGRPGLDTSGTAVIMTDNSSKQSIEQLLQGLGNAESQLLPKLVDVVNTEISQRVITSLEGALRWLQTTFFFTRLRSEPEKYGTSAVGLTNDSYLLELCEKATQQLTEAGMIQVAENGRVSALPACHIMSHGMVPFEAMKAIASLRFDATQCQVLTTISQMGSFHLPVRRHEKKFLNECHKTEVIRFKLDGPLSKVRVQEPSQKAFVLLQAYIGQHQFENYTLGQEMTTLADRAQRFLAAAQAYSVKGSHNGQVALQCLKLRRSLHLSLWGESSGVLNQIDGVGQKCTNMLKFHGIISFQQAFSSTDEAIEKASGSPKHFGKKLRSLVARILREKMQLSAEIEYTRGSNIAAGVVCQMRPCDPASALSEKSKSAVTYTLLAYTDRPSTCTFFQEGISGASSHHFPCPQQFGKLFIHLIASVIGMDETLVLDGNDDVLQSSFLSSPKGQRSGNKASTSKMRNVSATNVGDDPRIQRTSKPVRIARQNGISSLLIGSQRSQNEPNRLSRQGITRIKNTCNDHKGRESATAMITPQKVAPIISKSPQVDGNEPKKKLGPAHGIVSHNQNSGQVGSFGSRQRTAVDKQFNQSPYGSAGQAAYVTSADYTAQTSQPTISHDQSSGQVDSFGSRQRTAADRQFNQSPSGYARQVAYATPADYTIEVSKTMVSHHHSSGQVDSFGSRQTTIADKQFNQSPSGYARQASSVTPTDSAAQTSQTTARESGASEQPKKREVQGASAWGQTKRKQHKSQERAFATRRDNPFAFFQHDPNDAESFLEGLSTTNEPKSSIIPATELIELRRNTGPRGICQPERNRRRNMHPRRRRAFASQQKISNQQLLTMKAAEQQSYAATSRIAISPMQQSQHNIAPRHFGPPHESMQPYPATPHYIGAPVAGYTDYHAFEGGVNSPMAESSYTHTGGIHPGGFHPQPHPAMQQRYPHTHGPEDFQAGAWQYKEGIPAQGSWQQNGAPNSGQDYQYATQDWESPLFPQRPAQNTTTQLEWAGNPVSNGSLVNPREYVAHNSEGGYFDDSLY